ncbi:hypothetical protein [Streptomyces microflavus]|uniref:hypothetical protein n=1 Tax=Streptomyces microflavus TaxID=1919 RepID=UPI0032549AE6
MSDPNFARTWEYRFYDRLGPITVDRFPTGVDVTHGADDEAWAAVGVFKREFNVDVTRVERYDAASKAWVNVPK